MSAIAQSPHSSDSTPSPEPELEIKAQTRKRPQKQQPAKSKAKPLSPKHHTAHNIVEKRYRNNLNNKIAALRDSVPSLRITTKENNSDRDSTESDLEGRNEPQRLNKVSVVKTSGILTLSAFHYLLVMSSCLHLAPFLFKGSAPSLIFKCSFTVIY